MASECADEREIKGYTKINGKIERCMLGIIRMDRNTHEWLRSQIKVEDPIKSIIGKKISQLKTILTCFSL